MNAKIFTQLFMLCAIPFAMQGQLSAGMVTTESGDTAVSTCAGDGVADVIFFDSTGVNTTDTGAFTYVITDDTNIILGVPPSDNQDFEGAGGGVCRVWGLAYSGSLIAMPGDDASADPLSDGVWVLSDNFITVDRSSVGGGQVFTESGDSIVYTCLTDGINEVVSVDSFDVDPSANFAYVVTDDQNVILGLPPGDMVDLSGAGTGVCRIWGLSYLGDLTAMVGDTADRVALSDSCFALSSNFVTTIRDTVEGGMVMTEGGMDTVYTCASDGVDDIISFDSTGTSAALFTYVVTDDNNIILGIPPGDMQNFEGAGGGICRVWGLSYSGEIIAQPGDDAAQVALSDGCFDLSDNFVTVIRTEVNAGRVTTQSGDTTVYTCPGDGNDDLIQFDSIGASPDANFTYVVTDDQNIILGLPPGDIQNFEGAGVGVCRVWGLSYLGNITAQPGDDAAQVALSDSCFALSENFVVVVRDTAEGGMVMTEGGMDTVYTCAGDGVDDIISFDSIGTSSALFVYVVTNDNNIILGIPPGDMQNFEGAGGGVCRVWGLSYTGTITAQPGDDAAQVPLSDDCFDLSDNFVTVIRTEVSAGRVTTQAGDTVVYTCPGDGNDDLIQFDSIGASPDANFTYVVTDDQNIILGLPPGDIQNFEGAGVGICRVWGLSYLGNITAQPGDDAAQVALSDSCFVLSENFVVVVRDTAEGGMVSAENGQDTIFTCADDGIEDVFRFDSTGTSSANFAYVVTDDQNLILGLPPGDMVDFEPAGEGICRVWGLSYTGNLTAQIGDDASQVALSDDCFDLSDNFVPVVREADGEACQITNTVNFSEETELIVFPNPVSDILRIQWTRTSGNERLEAFVTDVQGRTLLQRRLNASENIDLDLSSLAPGLYIINVRSNKTTASTRILKQ